MITGNFWTFYAFIKTALGMGDVLRSTCIWKAANLWVGVFMAVVVLQSPLAVHAHGGFRNPGTGCRPCKLGTAAANRGGGLCGVGQYRDGAVFLEKKKDRPTFLMFSAFSTSRYFAPFLLEPIHAYIRRHFIPARACRRRRLGGCRHRRGAQEARP